MATWQHSNWPIESPEISRHFKYQSSKIYLYYQKIPIGAYSCHTMATLLCYHYAFMPVKRDPLQQELRCPHYSDIIMCAMVSQVTSVSIVCSTVCSGVDQRKHQSSASLAFVWGIHRWPVNSPHKGPVTRKCFHLMTSLWFCVPSVYMCPMFQPPWWAIIPEGLYNTHTSTAYNAAGNALAPQTHSWLPACGVPSTHHVS